MNHCFIIDDDVSFARSLKRLLEVEGIDAHVFVSAASFLDSVHPAQRGFALVDVHMPEMDGVSLLDKMHDLHYSMPVIVISGQTTMESRDLAIGKGALGFLQKPFNSESLLELIRGDRQEEEAP
jgi:FixJ family two-component response regulator